MWIISSAAASARKRYACIRPQGNKLTRAILSGVSTDRAPEIRPTDSLEFDLCQARWIVERVRSDRIYAQNLYAALCNTVWQFQDPWYILRGKTWCCSWRHAGAIVADIMGSGDYQDWYCSGSMTSHPDDDLGTAAYKIDQGMVPEGTVTQEIAGDFARMGWQLIK